jgi:large subunit ribosomal protein L19e
MKLEGKRSLAARSLNVGKGKVIFNVERLSEIKEAITKQDIKDLKQAGAISLKEKKGRRKVKRRKTRRRAGSIRKKVNTRKQDYVILTRKLRAYLSNLKSRGKITQDHFKKLRNEIKMSNFRSLAHMKETISEGDK